MIEIKEDPSKWKKIYTMFMDGKTQHGKDVSCPQSDLQV